MINTSGRKCLLRGSAVLLAILVFQVFCSGTSGSPIQSEDSAAALNEQAQELRDRYRTKLADLADTCEQDDMPIEASRARLSIPIRDPGRQYLFTPPTMAPAEPPDASDRQKSFHQQFTSIRKQYAAGVFQLAQFAARHSLGPQAYQLLHETLVYDPDHKLARTAMGFRNHQQFGWIRSAKPTRAWLARTPQKTIGWDKGTYWEIDSPHFKIYSAAGEKQGLELAAILEETYWVWRQVFFDYWSSPRHLNQWLEGSASDRSGKRQYKIILFRDRQQYLSDLAEVPNIDRSSGYYDENNRASFFYAAEKPPTETWRHETIHQLLQENAGANKTVADRGHAWLIEGIAMYFESMQVREDYITLGGFDAFRLQYARLRCKREGFFMPLTLLDALTRDELQNHQDAARLYSQASGISQFLMTAEGGRFRNGLIGFIKELYKDRRVKSTLAERTMPLDQLDRHYKEFLVIQRGDLINHFMNRDPIALALGRAGLKNQDLSVLENCRHLQWLELSGNPISDDAIGSLGNMMELTQLFLDVPSITDASIAKIVTLTALQELDLSSTGITNAGVRALKSLEDLQVLWLAGSRVTDQCIESLAAMPNLQLVDLRKTAVTKSAVKTLKALNPDLQIMH